jgi:3',5'-cyclic AMP phosphodiesterase CpdA
LKKIIHLSDIHIGAENLCIEPEDIARTLRDPMVIEDPSDHVVVITGDTVERGDSEAFLERARRLIDDLREAGFTVLVAPGNHDYGSYRFPFLGLSNECRRRYNMHIHDTTDVTYPIKTVIDDVAFLGLDSSQGEMDSWLSRWWADGRLGDEQLRELARMLDDDDVKNAQHTVIYLHHHPWKRGWLWYFLALNDSRELRRVLEGHDISALLFGHRHNAFDDYPKLLPITRIYDGGSSTGKGGKPCLYRVMDLSEDPRRDRAHTFSG